ncbi:MAG: NAD(P)H-dependent oxidoreductase [Candidatus Cloacimonetes bacterium]|nr:NAD(P)H-dependent oxidoreductase [Candidatus Cloacimonadota bacterium]
MNIIILHGSPRKGGDSDTLANVFLEEMALHRAIEVKHFYLNEMNIGFCQGCLACARDEEHKCVQTDDMRLIYEAFRDAEIVIWATPMYWGYMTAQMKTALDRMEALVCADGWQNKIFVVFLTYHYHVTSTVGFFERVCPFFETELHIVTCRTMDERTELPIAVKDMPEKLEEVRELAKGLMID